MPWLGLRRLLLAIFGRAFSRENCRIPSFPAFTAVLSVDSSWLASGRITADYPANKGASQDCYSLASFECVWKHLAMTQEARAVR
jgi:hypothetical protein